MHGERTTHDLLKVHALKVASLYVDHSEIQVSYRYPTDTRIVKYHAATFLTVSALTDLPFLKESTNRCARLMRTTGREDYGIFIDLFINRYHAWYNFNQRDSHVKIILKFSSDMFHNVYMCPLGSFEAILSFFSLKKSIFANYRTRNGKDHQRKQVQYDGEEVAGPVHEPWISIYWLSIGQFRHHLIFSCTSPITDRTLLWVHIAGYVTAECGAITPLRWVGIESDLILATARYEQGLRGFTVSCS